MSEIPLEGEVWYVALGSAIGHEANKTRRCLVVSANRFNTRRLVTVCPITNRPHPYPSFVEIEDVASAGLEVISYVRSEQVRTISTQRLGERTGHVAPRVLAVVRRNIKRHLSTP